MRHTLKANIGIHPTYRTEVAVTSADDLKDAIEDMEHKVHNYAKAYLVIEHYVDDSRVASGSYYYFLKLKDKK